jgi:hypothetical protein
VGISKLLGRYTITILFLVGMCIPATLTLLNNGFYEPSDLHHVADIYQMTRAFSSGQFPPRLGPDFTFGWGYPLFNFYYLLPFYMGAFFYSIFGSLTISFKMVFFESVIISVFGMYLFLREYFGKVASYAGTFLFLYTPYRAVQIYVRGAMGEALSLSFVPLFLWTLTRLIKYPTKKNIALNALVLFLFLIAHNYLWFLFLPFILLYTVILIRLQKNQKLSLRSTLLSVSLGALASSYFYIPAVLERHLIDRLTPFLLIDHFPFVKQLLFPSWGYGASVWGPGDGLSFQIGLVNILVILVALTFLFRKRKKVKKMEYSWLFVLSILMFFASVFMMNIRSLFLWNLVPFYNFIQFPWRLLLLTTFFSSVITAFVVSMYKDRKMIASAVCVASFLLTVSYFQPSQVFFKSDGAYLARFFASETYSEDYLLLPNWVDQRPDGPPAYKFEIANGSVEKIWRDSSVNWFAEVLADDDTIVTYYGYWFPGWFVKVDGELVETSPGKPSGQIEINIPKGEHMIEVYWAETRLRYASDILSLGAFIVIFYLLFKDRKKRRVSKK